MEPLPHVKRKFTNQEFPLCMITSFIRKLIGKSVGMCLTEGVSLYLLVHGPNLAVSFFFSFVREALKIFGLCLLVEFWIRELVRSFLILNSFGPRRQSQNEAVNFS